MPSIDEVTYIRIIPFQKIINSETAITAVFIQNTAVNQFYPFQSSFLRHAGGNFI